MELKMEQTGTVTFGNTKTNVTRNNSKARIYSLTWNGTEEQTKSRFEGLKNYINGCLTIVKAVIQIEFVSHWHIQGYIEYKNPVSFNSMTKQYEGAHIEKAKMPKNLMEYCMKHESFVEPFRFLKGFPKPVIDPLEGKQLKHWQIEILQYIKGEVNEREILWYVDLLGGKGKTSLAKSICINNPKRALYLSGASKDVKHGVVEFLQGNDNELKVAMFDFCRSHDGFVSYQALEEIKNGIFFSSKYESKQVIFNSPHVIVFSNFKPDLTKLSEDRWNVRII